MAFRKLPRLKSDVPTKTMSDKVVSLLAETDLIWTSTQIISLTKTIESDLAEGYDELVKIDEIIGGVGLHNVHRPVGDDVLSGNYKIEFRPQFRPIQYVYQGLSWDDLPGTARNIVSNSCLHVEYAVKLRFGIAESTNKSLGVLIDDRNIRRALDHQLLTEIKNLNRLVYRRAKHTIEQISLDSHDFTPSDAIGIYLVCRWIGIKLLDPIDVFNRWRREDE